MYKKAVLSVLALMLAGCVFGCKKKSADKPTSGEQKAAEGAVDVELYVMSQCPYGVLALDAMLPAVEKLGSAVNLKLITTYSPNLERNTRCNYAVAVSITGVRIGSGKSAN